MSIFEYNGSAIVAMAGEDKTNCDEAELVPLEAGKGVCACIRIRLCSCAGKECVAIGSDLRFGVQLQTMTTDRPKVHKIHDKLYLGLSGLASDTQTLLERLMFRHNLYKLREERNMKPVVSQWPWSPHACT